MIYLLLYCLHSHIGIVNAGKVADVLTASVWEWFVSKAFSVHCYGNFGASLLISPSAEFFTVISLVPGSQGSDICYWNIEGLNFFDYLFSRLSVQTARGFYFSYIELWGNSFGVLKPMLPLKSLSSLDFYVQKHTRLGNWITWETYPFVLHYYSSRQVPWSSFPCGFANGCAGTRWRKSDKRWEEVALVMAVLACGQVSQTGLWWVGYVEGNALCCHQETRLVPSSVLLWVFIEQSESQVLITRHGGQKEVPAFA